MRLGRYAAWMMIDVENILEAIVGIEVDSTVIETLIDKFQRRLKSVLRKRFDFILGLRLLRTISKRFTSYMAE